MSENGRGSVGVGTLYKSRRSHESDLVTDSSDAKPKSLDIPFGMRRFRLALVLFFGGGFGFIGWSRTVDSPMFIFPLGRLDAEDARLALLVVGVLATTYAATLAYLRFVKRPRVVLRKSSITIPIGEFATTTIKLAKGDVLDVREDGPKPGGWRTCHVRYRGGTFALRSSQVPSDDDFFEICARLRTFQQGPPAP